MEEDGARGVGAVGLELLGDAAAELVAQLREQLRARAERGAVGLVGDRDGDVAAPRERGDQLELLRGEVVEAVEQDGPAAPRVRAPCAAPRSRSRASEWRSQRPAPSRSRS